MTPAGQRWTRDKPTEPGWYWLRRVGGVTVVEVISVPGYEPKHWIVEGVNLRWSLGNMDGEWLGPITPTDDAALRRAKAEGAREMIKIVNDNKADQRVADNLDNTLSFDSFNEVLDAITCEIDARAAQIEEGE